MKTPRFYVYKCVVDDGGAPCVDEGLLSLTICKPYIRSTAEKGDYIFAFGSNDDTPKNRLVYIAEVSERIQNAEYFERDEYRKRGDCIYERQALGKLARRADARFHDYPGARASDLGDEPNYPKANALIAQDFRYFGRTATDAWKAKSQHLRELVEDLRQGHRVNFVPQLLAELVALKNQVWMENPNEKVLGTPLHARSKNRHPDPDECVTICGASCCYNAS